MRVSDLTDEDIGRWFLVPEATGSGRRRLMFEGFTRRPFHPSFSSGDGRMQWLIMRVSPGTAGAMVFRDMDNRTFSGVLVRSTAIICPLEVEYGVSAAGELIELSSTPVRGGS